MFTGRLRSEIPPALVLFLLSHSTSLSSGTLHDDIPFFLLVFASVDLPRRCSDAGWCPVNSVGPQ